MTLDIGPRCISSALWTFAFPFPSCVVSFPSLFQPSSYCTVYLIRICSLYSFIQYSGLYILSFILVFALIVFPQKVKEAGSQWVLGWVLSGFSVGPQRVLSEYSGYSWVLRLFIFEYSGGSQVGTYS